MHLHNANISLQVPPKHNPQTSPIPNLQPNPSSLLPNTLVHIVMSNGSIDEFDAVTTACYFVFGDLLQFLVEG